MNRRDPERTALKEWAVLCEALGDGRIIALVRKGGVREQRAGFSLRHERFLLYPTHFHERPADVASRFHDELSAAPTAKPATGEIAFRYVARVAVVWHVTDLDALRGVEYEQGLTWPAMEARFMYRDRPAVCVVAVRISELPSAVVVPETRRYGGCVSWVELDQSIDVDAARPVLAAAAFARRLARLQHLLGDPVAPATPSGVAE